MYPAENQIKRSSTEKGYKLIAQLVVPVTDSPTQRERYCFPLHFIETIEKNHR